MKFSLYLSLKAKKDIAEIAQYIASDSPESSVRFLDYFFEVTDILLEMPNLGKKYQTINVRLKNLRLIPVPKFFNYIIFYQPSASKIKIVRVIHSARDYPIIFEE